MFLSLRPLATKFLDILLPSLCPACETQVETNRTLCPTCWSKMHFIIAPYCATCGLPFDVPVDAGTQCGACLAEPPPFHTARAATVYNDESRHLILAFKHGDRTYMAPTLATWMHRAGAEFLSETDYLIPVPLHRRRLFHRRYNQAALLAYELSKKIHKPVLVDALTRTRSTPTQGHLSRKERAENVKNAFQVTPRHTQKLQGKRVTLIDDVYTTGATLRECCAILIKAGVARVDVLTFTRVRSAD